jgi:hypothetical protein
MASFLSKNPFFFPFCVVLVYMLMWISCCREPGWCRPWVWHPCRIRGNVTNLCFFYGCRLVWIQKMHLASCGIQI